MCCVRTLQFVCSVRLSLFITACPALGSSQLSQLKTPQRKTNSRLRSNSHLWTIQPDARSFGLWQKAQDLVGEHTDQAWGWKWNRQLYHCEPVDRVYTDTEGLALLRGLNYFSLITTFHFTGNCLLVSFSHWSGKGNKNLKAMSCD